MSGAGRLTNAAAPCADTAMDDWTAVEVIGGDARGGIVLVCEHAAFRIPASLQGLGLTEEARLSHAAWDPGARDVAVALAGRWNAPLVAGTLSRLVYDVNRPPESETAVRAVSERHAVPGNAGLSAEQLSERATRVHDPFHAVLAEVVECAAPRALVTVHSFTPIYDGAVREVELGFLHDRDDRLARAACEVARAAGRYRAELNAPYAASDGVTYTLRRHADSRGLPHVMVEIRNDLIATPGAARAMADHLGDILDTAMERLP